MPVQLTQTHTISPALRRALEAHRAEVARLREELGDPEEAIRRLVRETFSAEALNETFREYVDAGYSLDERDDDVPSHG